MNNIPIKLNFLPLSDQNISFKVYRQEFHGQPKESGYYKAKLPKVPGGEEYSDYWTTFQEQKGFECYTCDQKDNIYLTLDLFWITFLTKIKETLRDTEYIINDRKFNRFVSMIIADHSEGKEVINIEPYYLKEANKFGFLVDFRFKPNKGIPFSRKIQQLSLSLDKNFYTNKNYYSDKYDKIIFFIKNHIGKIFPLVIESKEFHLDTNLFSMRSQSLKTKTYVFKDEKESNSQFNGLKEKGPVRSIDKEPLMVFIFQDNQKDLANEVYYAIIGKTYPFTFPGMEKMFNIKLAKENVVKINIKSFSEDELENVKNELEKIKKENDNKIILGLFIEYSKDAVASNSEFSPYYFLKYIFTKKQTPLQAVTIERIKGRDGLKWSASGIGLQIFAKLGGIPWKVKPSNDKCIIFGLGSAHDKDNATGQIKKYFAYSVCMDSSGIYKKIDVLGTSTNKDDYICQLKQNIKNVISEYLEKDKNIEKCVLHLPFKIKKDEMVGMRESISSMSTEHKEIEFQFIKINTDNKFFGYAENNSKVPYESSYIKLSKNEYLVWFEGLQYGKENVSKKVANPVCIEFMGESNLDDEKRQKYLQDIINLSGTNWRGFNAKLSPISIYYPEIIAKYIAEFRKYDEGDNIDISKITIPWFL